jgi:hypothetical protein
MTEEGDWLEGNHPMVERERKDEFYTMTDATDATVQDLADTLAASRELNAAMAFGVPEEAWDDCRRGIAASLAPLVTERETQAARKALHDAAEELGDHRTLPNEPDEAMFAVIKWLRERAEQEGP